jgi:hypothetical protein
MTKADLNTTTIPSRRAVLAAGPAVAAAALAGGTVANTAIARQSKVRLARQSRWPSRKRRIKFKLHHTFNCLARRYARKAWPFRPPPSAALGLTGAAPSEAFSTMRCVG